MLWVVLVLACLVLAWWPRRRHASDLEPPSYPGRLPIIGHTLLFWNRNSMFNSFQNMTKYAMNQMGCEPFIVYIGPFKKYFFCDLDDCLTLSNVCLNRNYTFIERVIKKGLLTSDVKTWKRDRKLLNPAFSFTVLNGYMPILNHKAKQFLTDLSPLVGKGLFKPDHLVADYVLKTTCHTTVHYKADDVISNNYKRTFDQLMEIYMERFKKFWLYNDYVYEFTSLYQKELELTKIITEATRKAIRERRSQLLHNNEVNKIDKKDINLGDHKKPLLDLLLQLEMTQNTFTEEDIIQHLITGIVATYDTNCRAIKFLLLLIGSHERVQERLYEELQEVFGNTERDVEMQDLSKLVYLEAVINETLRLYPVIPFLARVSDTEVKLTMFNSLQTMTKYAIGQMRCEPFIVYFGPFKKYFFSDLEDCLILSNTCLKKNYSFVERLVEKGLLTSDVKTWKRDRKLLNPAFSFTVLNGYLPVFNHKAKQFVTDFAPHLGKGLFRPDDLIADYVLKTTCHTTVNFKTDDIISNNYKNTFDELMEIYVERFQKFWLHKKIVYEFTPLSKKEIGLTQIITDITKKAILKRRSELSQNHTNDKNDNDLDDLNKPLLDLLLQLEVTQNAFTEEELLHHLITGIIATYDTSSKAIKFLLLVIGSHKHVQDRIYEELQEVFGDTVRDVDKLDLSRLVYLEAVIKETLRLYPVTAYVARISETDIKLKKYTIPARSHVVLLLYALNRHPVWGPDADEFRPERWLEKGGVPDNPNALTIFGIGRRHCIGKRYAMMLMKVTLVHFLRQYQVSGDVSKLQVNLDFMVTPTSGHEISIEARN